MRRGLFEGYSLQLTEFIVDGTIPIEKGGPRAELSGAAIEWVKGALPTSVKERITSEGCSLTFTHHFSGMQGLEQCLNEMLVLQEIGYTWEDLSYEPQLFTIQQTNPEQAEKLRLSIQQNNEQDAVNYLTRMINKDIYLRSYIEGIELLPDPLQRGKPVILRFRSLTRILNRRAIAYFDIIGGYDNKELLEIVDKIRERDLTLYSASLKFKYVGDYLAVVDKMGELLSMDVPNLIVSSDMAAIYDLLYEESRSEISLELYVPSPYVWLPKTLYEQQVKRNSI